MHAMLAQLAQSKLPRGHCRKLRPTLDAAGVARQLLGNLAVRKGAHGRSSVEEPGGV